MSERLSNDDQLAPNTDLEDTREFTDAELMEAGLIIEFFRKHPEFRWPRGFPYGNLVELARTEAEQHPEIGQNTPEV
jgi:hypothetical protein